MLTQLCKHSVEALDEESARCLLRKDWPKDVSLSEMLLTIEKNLLRKYADMPLALEILGSMLRTNPQNELEWQVSVWFCGL
jgi:hypothetical protein